MPSGIYPNDRLISLAVMIRGAIQLETTEMQVGMKRLNVEEAGKTCTLLKTCIKTPRNDATLLG